MSTSQVSLETPTNVADAAPPSRPDIDPEIRRILGLSVPVTVALAERDMPIKSILSLTVGSIIEFSIPFDADLTLRVANQPIGRGQAVKVGENFGVRMTAINDLHERIEALAGA